MKETLFPIAFLLLLLFSCSNQSSKATFVDTTKEKRQKLLTALKAIEHISYDECLTDSSLYKHNGEVSRNEHHVQRLKHLFTAFSLDSCYNLFHGSPKELANYFAIFAKRPPSQLPIAFNEFIHDRTQIKRNTPFSLMELKEMRGDSLRLEAIQRKACSWKEAMLSERDILRTVLYFDQNIREEYRDDPLYRFFRNTLLSTRYNTLSTEKDLLELTLLNDSLFVEGDFFGSFAHHRVWQDSLFKILITHKKQYDRDSTTFFSAQKARIQATDGCNTHDILALIKILKDGGYSDIVASRILGKSQYHFSAAPILNHTAEKQFHDSAADRHKSDEYSKLFGTHLAENDTVHFAILSISPDSPFETCAREAFKTTFHNGKEYTLLFDTTKALHNLPTWGNDTPGKTVEVTVSEKRFLSVGDITLIDKESNQMHLSILPRYYCQHHPPGPGGHTVSGKCSECQSNYLEAAGINANDKKQHSRSRYGTLRVVRQQMPNVHKLHKKRVKEKPEIYGKFLVKVGINGRGKTTYCRIVESALNDSVLEKQIEDLFRTFAYATLEDTTVFTEFQYPMYLRKYDVQNSQRTDVSRETSTKRER